MAAGADERVAIQAPTYRPSSAARGFSPHVSTGSPTRWSRTNADPSKRRLAVVEKNILDDSRPKPKLRHSIAEPGRHTAAAQRQVVPLRSASQSCSPPVCRLAGLGHSRNAEIWPVPALTRGLQQSGSAVVTIGDTRQLAPPTSFQNAPKLTSSHAVPFGDHPLLDASTTLCSPHLCLLFKNTSSNGFSEGGIDYTIDPYAGHDCRVAPF